MVTKSRFVTSPISSTSKRPSSGCASGASHMRAAVVLAVRDDDVVHARLAPLAVVELDGDDGVLPLEEDADERVEERRLAAHRLGHAVRPLRHRRAHPDAADVRVVALRVGAVPGAVRDAADVDDSHDAVARDRDRVLELRRDPVRAAEVHAGAERDDRQLGRRAGAHESVHHLVHRPVAARRDDRASRRRRRRAPPARSGGRAARRRASRPPARGAPRGSRAPASASRWRRCRRPG